MTKDIYIIKNKINNKVYIGQSINAKQRFISHKSRARTNADHSPIHDAMIALGVENFYIEILESQIENYNKREKYWIKYYNSLIPNGYNLAEGGDEPPYTKGEDCYNASLTNQQADILINELINSNKTLSEIAKEYNVNYKVLRNINYGESWKKDNLKYPLKTEDDRTTIKNNDVKLNKIIWLLSNSTCSMEQIGNYFNVGRKVIERINSGKTHYSEKLSYPIRKVRKRSKETVKEALIKGGFNE